MAKFKPGDKVKSSVDGKTYIAMEESRPGYWWLADLDGRGNGLETREIDLTLANSRAPRSSNAVVQNAINARKARNAINFNGASAKVRKALEGRLEKLVQKFKNDLNAVVADVGREYKKYQSIEPDSASLIKEVEYWIDSLKDAISQTW